MTKRQESALAYVKTLYAEGAISSDATALQIPSIAGAALTRDLLGLLGSTMRDRVADILGSLAAAVRGKQS